jgi:hypothetical protein
VTLRLVVEVHCDAPSCPRSTRATASEERFAWTVLGGGVASCKVGRDIRFPPSPAGEASEWREDEHGCWCPEHGGKDSAKELNK